ncbi:HNH endonuclease [Nocardiopsis sp. NPDC057823]|uniref:HNH endonuclease n=1 Tax=Nocardiopsis sp. NPDC057823 TaxID=3346256 RepID=UPI003671347D
MIPDDPTALDYRRGRSGRPLQRLKAWLKDEGTNTCWLCGRPIDMVLTAADPNHREAWTLDHRVPLSRGGDPLDPANAREAHRRCNSARGNREPRPRPNASRRW